MSALVLDAGAFIAVDRNDRSMIARLRVAQLHGHELRTSAIVVAQVWRSAGGKQARVANLLRAVDVRPIDERMGRDAGALLAKARTDDPIDATVVLVARSGDRILTSDPDDIGRLVSGTGKQITIVPC
ncbi:MAG: PIN domain-containing protein [Steroidobacteraceae bacterium]